MNKCMLRIFRFVIVLINVVFMILGLTLMAIGIVGKFYPDNPLVDEYEGDIKDTMKKFLEGTGDDTTKLEDFHVTDIFAEVAVAMIAAGAVIFVLCFVAIGGAAYKIRIYLLVYAIALTLIVVAQLLAVIIIYSSNDMAVNKIKSQLSKSINEKYEGFAGLNIESIGWNFVMNKFSCCGVNDYMDFDTATKWSKTKVVSSLSTTFNLVMPIYCCSTLPKDGNLTCAETVSGNSNTGCFQVVWDIVFGDGTLMALSLLAGFVIQAFIIVASILIFMDAKKNKVKDSLEKLMSKDEKKEEPASEKKKKKMAHFSFNIETEKIKKEKEKAEKEKKAKEQTDWDE